MPRIQVLEQHVAELIAAGEVVERPASIVKELLENAVDAGAQKITVEIQQGGISYIRITDDGCGIEMEDLPKAFVRHATSKVHTARDLEAIGSFGFRGEALASIAAVSKVEVLSCTADALAGGRYVIHGSQEVSCEEAGCPVGTTIVVRDLFYNTPARMKFLKKDSTEASSIANIVDKIALGNPHIAFRFIKDGQLKLNTPGDGNLQSVIYAVYGREFASQLLQVDYTQEFVHVSGFICQPSDSKATRNMQNFFINSRYVKSKTCVAAVEEAYKSSLMTGRFPACVLNVEVPLDAVDVNVHPAKIEVRFSNEKPIFSTVYHGCKEALNALNRTSFLQEAQTTAKEKLTPFALQDFDYTGRQQRFSSEQYQTKVTTAPEKPVAAPAFTRPVLQTPAFEEHPHTTMLASPDLVPYRTAYTPPPEPSAAYREQPPVPSPHTVQQPSPPIGEQKDAAAVTVDCAEEADVCVIGELFGTYILVQYEQQLVLVDKHAAHERILYNQLKAAVDIGDRQMLISPLTVSLSKLEYRAAVDQPEVFLQFGLSVEDFGEGTVTVREVPTMLPLQAVAPSVQEIAAKLLAGSRELLPEAVDDLLHNMACRAAIKAHDRTTPFEMSELIQMIRQDSNVRFCPHGRPVAVTMSRTEIEKRFGRLV